MPLTISAQNTALTRLRAPTTIFPTGQKNKSAEQQEKLFAVAKYVAREFAKLLDDELVYVRNYLYEEAVNLDWEKY